ncbi:hypothetical protein EDB80DRAFT_708869 [Ilyonectria destructans]|nr:hypothetical protein EDB80DRAFT_708869 [Ilyonectria destructans]
MSLSDTPVGFVGQWIHQQSRLHLPPTWKGGWERWAQGQIALFMEGQNGYQVWTEEHIYRDNPTDAVDLEFRKPAGTNGVRTFLELKCYSATNEDSAQTFITRVLQDYDKVQRRLTSGVPGEPDARGSTLWVIGISQRQFKNWIEDTGSGNAKWQQFQSVDVTGEGIGGSQGTFDLWYWHYTNNK